MKCLNLRSFKIDNPSNNMYNVKRSKLGLLALIVLVNLGCSWVKVQCLPMEPFDYIQSLCEVCNLY